MKKILIVNANYYNEITNKLVNASKKTIKSKKFKVFLVNVPGIFEVPIIIRKNIKKFDGFIAIGCVIKGETPHFNLICNTSFDAIMKLSIEYSKPIGNGIITALNKRQAFQRCGILKSNKNNKGIEAAKAVIAILNNGTKKI